MTTQLGSIQSFVERDGKTTSRQWVRDFSIMKFKKGLLSKVWDGTVNPGHPPAIARVDFGRWIAECGFCHEFCMVDPDDDFFFCLYCAGNGTGEAGIVIFPAENERLEIESALLERPVIERGHFSARSDQLLHALPVLLPRNWKPGQTRQDLLDEVTAASFDLIEISPSEEQI